MERKFLDLATAKKASEATEALRALSSALDKAAKTQVVTKNLANRKKSRLAARLKTATAA